MAGAAPPSPSPIKLAADILSCVICTEAYTIGGAKGPISLSCGHSFCASAAARWGASSGAAS